MELNQQQVASAMRVILGAGGPIAALILTKTGMSEGDYAMYLNVALAVVPPVVVGIWGYISARAVSQIANVEKLPDVATVVVKDTANGKVGDMARDQTSHPNVVTETQNEADAKAGTKT